MGGGSAPAAPDYAGAAKEQGAASERLANQQTVANRPTVNTPWGTSTWTQGSRFDQAAYDKAMAEHQAYKPGTESQQVWSEGQWGGSGDSDPIGRGWTTVPGTAASGRATAPTREEFTTSDGSWTQDIKLSPEQQKALDSQQRIQAGQSAAAEGLLGQATEQFSKPMDWSKLNPAGKSVAPGQLQTSVAGAEMRGDVPLFSFKKQMDNTAGGWRQNAQSAVEQLQAPGLAQRRAAVETQLSNQGLTPGSEAWKNAMREVGDQENRAGLEAIAAGRDEANMLFGQDLQGSQFTNQANAQDFQQNLAAGEFSNQAEKDQLTADITQGTFANQAQQQQMEMALRSGQFDNDLRKMGISEEQLRRGMTLNELNALLSGNQVQTPNFGTAPTAGRAETPDLMGAATNQYQGALDGFNVAQSNRASTTAGLTSAAMMALYAFSDARLKRDIEWLGFTLPNGIKLYKYRFLGKSSMEIGVLAQEVMEIMPDAVTYDSHGFMMVDYAKVLA